MPSTTAPEAGTMPIALIQRSLMHLDTSKSSDRYKTYTDRSSTESISPNTIYNSLVFQEPQISIRNFTSIKDVTISSRAQPERVIAQQQNCQKAPCRRSERLARLQETSTARNPRRSERIRTLQMLQAKLQSSRSADGLGSESRLRRRRVRRGRAQKENPT